MESFLGYNQIVVHIVDSYQTTFTTPWGTCMYKKMSFGNIDVGAKF